MTARRRCIALAFVGVAALLSSGCADRPKVRRPDVLLISIDTLRADHLGCYGHPRPTSPIIDSLAQQGVRFESAFATAPNTAPSHMSMMTSLYPTAHAVQNASSEDVAATLMLPPDTQTLAEVLREAGYQTIGFADGGNLSRAYGFDRGFDRYRSFYEGVTSKVDQTIGWLRDHKAADRPFFVFLHTYQVHAPYLPPREFAERFVGSYDGWAREFCFDADGDVKDRDLSGFNKIFDDPSRLQPADVAFLRDLYDAGIAYTDHELGRLFGFLHDQGLGENLLVVLLSDHGEEFGEHGAYGHKQVFDEVTRVPLILNGPMLAASRPVVTEQVSLLDVLPSVLDIVGLPTPAQAQGRSLLAAIRAGAALEPRPAFAELIGHDPGPILSMLRTPAEKLMFYRSPRADKTTDGTPALRLFDLPADPGEQHNVADPERDRARALRKQLEAWERENLTLRERFGARARGDEKAPTSELQQLGY